MKILWRFMKYSISRWRLMLLEVFLVAAILIANLAIPRLLGTAIDETLTRGLRSEQIQLAVVIILLSILRGFGGYFEHYVIEVISGRSAEDLRNDIFNKLLGLSPNPPKDTDGRREESGMGVRELQGK